MPTIYPKTITTIQIIRALLRDQIMGYLLEDMDVPDEWLIAWYHVSQAAKAIEGDSNE